MYSLIEQAENADTLEASITHRKGAGCYVCDRPVDAKRFEIKTQDTGFEVSHSFDKRQWSEYPEAHLSEINIPNCVVLQACYKGKAYLEQYLDKHPHKRLICVDEFESNYQDIYGRAARRRACGHSSGYVSYHRHGLMALLMLLWAYQAYYAVEIWIDEEYCAHVQTFIDVLEKALEVK